MSFLNPFSEFLYAVKKRFFPRLDNRLRVLMYHKFSATEQDFLTIKTADFEKQLIFLQQEGYKIVKMSDVVAAYLDKKPLPPKPVLITFDDAYCSNRDEVLPILQKHQASATIFVPTAYIGTASNWDTAPSPILSLNELKNLPPSVFQLALHTHQHGNYKNLSLEDIKTDVDACLAFFQENQLAHEPVFAYAYGARPKNAAILRGMQQHFSERGIRLAFRIGNRHNSLTTNNLYELQRLDVRGDESFEAFVKKVRWGKF